MSDARKGTTNAGSIKKGERRSKKTEFKKGQVPHNKGVKASKELRKINSIRQKKRWDKLGRQSKEEYLRKEAERIRKKRKDPNYKEYEKKYRKELYAKNRVRLRKEAGIRRKENPEYSHQKNLADKLTVLRHYSKVISNSDIPCCACCGENLSHKFLAIDHIRGRKSMKHKRGFGGDKIYRWCIRNNFPEGLQILCHNCNTAKGEKGICPHKLLK